MADVGPIFVLGQFVPQMARILIDPPANFCVVRAYLEAIDAKMDAVLSDGSGDGPRAGVWAVYRLHHQRSRYIFKMYESGQIDTALYRYLCDFKYLDTHLAGFWKRRGYENLCCLRCIDPCSKSNNVCVCRVPERHSDQQHAVECGYCGCRGCSGY